MQVSTLPVSPDRPLEYHCQLKQPRSEKLVKGVTAPSAGYCICARQGEGKDVREVSCCCSCRSQGVRTMSKVILKEVTLGTPWVAPAPLWKRPKLHKVCRQSDPSPRWWRTPWDLGFQERGTLGRSREPFRQPLKHCGLGKGGSTSC